ncbi:MAG: hypothetical protein QF714_08210 [Dehalococcoidia bacterium]|nr:hypothetical protein [Dehalococcoidia bacterium]MDP6227668.1 hypothetical protein [Dehalococcoidia bacterium]MDP7084763.1 hypothetical protein [Dehalococcoidia bacterium]MDP7201554.1 hypothetical protein [Dehalococcoidia bacterium]MDP7511866.1 hypothetical protein [Dehalococcoidia bacterium]
MALPEERAISLTHPSIGLPASLWVGIGLFGLAGGAFLLFFTGPVLDGLVRLAESYRAGGSPLSDERVAALEHGVRVWGWSGLLIWGVTLPLWRLRVRAYLAGMFHRLMLLAFRPLPLPADRYSRRFFVAVAGVLAFTLLTHWSLTAYKDVAWFGGEDGVSEWWSVATYLAGAAMAGATGWMLRGTGHPRLALFHAVLAASLLIGAMEEISWGQRLFDWGTPAALSEINEQGETTLHNLESVDSVISSILFGASLTALAGAAIRAAWHRSGRVTSADLVLPSLVLAPSLLMILVWRVGNFWTPVNLPRLLMEAFDFGPQGSEVPEVLLGLCLCIYTYANLTRATILRRLGAATPGQRTGD